MCNNQCPKLSSLSSPHSSFYFRSVLSASSLLFVLVLLSLLLLFFSCRKWMMVLWIYGRIWNSSWLKYGKGVKFWWRKQAQIFSLLFKQFNEAFNMKKENLFLVVFEKEKDLESILLKSTIAQAVESHCDEVIWWPSNKSLIIWNVIYVTSYVVK